LCSPQTVGHSLFPPPADINLADPEDVKRLMASLPAAAFAFVLLGWFLGSFVGSFVARKIARSNAAAWAVAVLFILFTAMNFVMIPHPLWMIAAGVLIPLASAWLAIRFSGPAQRP
jgi:ABC-type Na+ efflux pump permease subunit